jgi:hypothetical protein
MIKMKNEIIFSVDVEPDLHTGGNLGISKGLHSFEKICDKNNVRPVLFVTGNCVKENKELFKRLHKKGWEISLHGFSHKRFDEMQHDEKEKEIKKSLEHFKKYLGFKPQGFRAPQHSIDDETLNLLEKYDFKYDSSFTPLNFLQFIFFPKKLSLGLKSFFSPLNPYKIRKNLSEVPTSSLLIPFVSLLVRVSPKFLLRLYIGFLRLLYKNPVFYAHSWDFIELKQSKIDRNYSHKKFIRSLDYVMSL